MSKAIHIHRLGNPGGAGMVLTWIHNDLSSRYDELIELEIDPCVREVPVDLVMRLGEIIESNVPVYLESDLADYYVFYYNLAIQFPDTKFILRLHDQMLVYGRDFNNSESISFGKYEYKTALRILDMLKADNINLLVGNSTDYTVFKLLGYGDRVDLRPFTGINTPAMSDKKKDISILSNPNNNIMFISSYYSKAKGTLILFHAINESSLHEYDWYIVGNILSGSEYEIDYEEYTDLFNSIIGRNDVHFLGNVPNKELSKYYELCDTLFLPSYSESYCLTAIEANSYGNRIIYLDLYNLPWMHNSNATPVVIDSPLNMSVHDIGVKCYNVIKNNIRETKFVTDDTSAIIRTLLTILSDNCNIHEDIIL